MQVDDRIVVSIELMLRTLDEKEPGAIKSIEQLRQRKDLERYETTYANQTDKLTDDSLMMNEAGKKVVNLLDEKPESNEDHASLMTDFIELLETYKDDEEVAFAIINAIPLETLTTQFGDIKSNFKTYPPAVQLSLATIAAAQPNPRHEQYNFIFKAAGFKHAELLKAVGGFCRFSHLFAGQ